MKKIPVSPFVARIQNLADEHMCSAARGLSKTHQCCVWVTLDNDGWPRLEVRDYPTGIVISQYENGKHGTRLEYEPKKL
jgi:hypothetical protein